MQSTRPLPSRKNGGSRQLKVFVLESEYFFVRIKRPDICAGPRILIFAIHELLFACLDLVYLIVVENIDIGTQVPVLEPRLSHKLFFTLQKIPADFKLLLLMSLTVLSVDIEFVDLFPVFLDEVTEALIPFLPELAIIHAASWRHLHPPVVSELS